MDEADKTGFKTSEFWAATAGSLIAIFNNALGLDLDASTIQAFIGLIASYVLGRSIKKGLKKT